MAFPYFPENGFCGTFKTLGRLRGQKPASVASEVFRASGRPTGMYGPPLRRKRNVGMSQVGLRKVYGLCWSESLLARMECAALFSPLVSQSLETFSGYGCGC